MSHSAMPIATDPLGAIRTELVGAARRRKMARRRRKRLSTTAAVGFATLAMAAGATAVMDVSTGVPAIDRLLQTQQSHLGTETPSDFTDRPEVADLAIADVENAVAQPLEVPLTGGAQGTGVNYLSRSGGLCFAFVATDGEGVSEARESVGGCKAPAAVTQRLADQAAFIAGLSLGGTLVLNGYLREDVVDLDVQGPNGPLAVRLSDRTWEPQVEGAEPIRVFLAYAPLDEAKDGLNIDEEARLINGSAYELKARLRDGRIVESRR